MWNGSDHCMVDPVLGLDVNVGLTGGALSFDVCVSLIGILSNRWRTAEFRWGFGDLDRSSGGGPPWMNGNAKNGCFFFSRKKLDG